MGSNPIGGVGKPSPPPGGTVGPQSPPPQPAVSEPIDAELIRENETAWDKINAANRNASEYFAALEWLAKKVYGAGWNDAVKQAIEAVGKK